MALFQLDLNITGPSLFLTHFVNETRDSFLDFTCFSISIAGDLIAIIDQAGRNNKKLIHGRTMLSLGLLRGRS